MNPTELSARISAWLDVLNNTTGPDPANHQGKPYATFVLVPNASPTGRYSRIVRMLGVVGQESVHAFVDAQGNVYKPAGWKAPAKGVRYSLADDASFALLLSNARGGWAGGYLYANRDRRVSIIG